MAISCVYVAVVILATSVKYTCEGTNLTFHGLINAEKIEKQINLIEILLGKLFKKTNCSVVAQSSNEDNTSITEEIIGVELEINETTDMKEENKTLDETCDYGKISKKHTAILPPNKECEINEVGITTAERDLILDYHNQLRAKVANGNETRGDPGPQPPATNMMQMVWNDDLAVIAQAWASQCPSGHDKERNRRLCSRKYKTGQNINYFWGVLEEGSNWTQAIDNWYNEVDDVAVEVAKSFKPHETKKIGHYTQLVWGSSNEIGCGIVYYKIERKGIVYSNSITYVCNYGPAGNFLNHPFYEHGLAASNCPNSVSEEYPGLCL